LLKLFTSGSPKSFSMASSLMRILDTYHRKIILKAATRKLRDGLFCERRLAFRGAHPYKRGGTQGFKGRLGLSVMSYCEELLIFAEH